MKILKICILCELFGSTLKYFNIKMFNRDMDMQSRRKTGFGLNWKEKLDLQNVKGFDFGSSKRKDAV